MSSRSRGAEGERKAAEYLRRHGYTLLATNFRSARAEIDIVATKGERVVFVEVKYWKALAARDLEYSINPRKQRRIRQASQYFIHKHPEFENAQVGFDVILVSEPGSRITHYENAFEAVGLDSVG
jgi:putative endonuclease